MNVAQEEENRVPCWNFKYCGNLASPEETMCSHCSKGAERLIEEIFSGK